MTIQFEVIRQRITNTSTAELVVADSREFLHAQFRLSDEWAGTVCTVVFAHGGEAYHVILDSANRCTVPWEVIKPPFFTVSVFAVGGAGKLVTANIATVLVTPSGMVDGQAPAPPTPNEFAQLLQKISQKADSMVYQGGVLQLMGEGMPVGSPVHLPIGEAGGVAHHVQLVEPFQWLDRGVHWELQIPMETHYLGYSVAVVEVLRESGQGLESVLCHTLQLPNGTVCIQSDMAFAGRIVLERV